MPRAALLSIHARVEGTEPSTWEDPSLVQVWGPRFSAYVVAAPDLAVFTLGRLPDDAKQQASRRTSPTSSKRSSTAGGWIDEAGEGLGVHPNALRYAAPTGRVLIRWDGARRPTIWTVPRAGSRASEARLELARRYVHVFGPTSAAAFAEWAGVGPAHARTVFEGLAGELTPVTTPIGDAWILAPTSRLSWPLPAAPATARLLPSGDTWFLLQGRDRELLVPDAGPSQRALDEPRLARRRPRRGRGRRHVAAREREALDQPVARAFPGGDPGRRRRGGVSSTARHPGVDRRPVAGIGG